jgi:serine protease Do
MKRWLKAGLALCLAGGCTGPAQLARGSRVPGDEAFQHFDRREVAKQILPSSVRLVVYDGETARRTASGVVVGNERGPSGVQSFVLTNAHVLDTAGIAHPKFQVLVEHRGGADSYWAEAVAQGSVPDLDLGLLRVWGAALSPAQLASDEELEPGEDVVVASAPFGRAVSLSGGMVSQIEWDPQGKKMQVLKTDAPIGYGASGGGIYSASSGRLLAVVEGYRTAKIGFAVADQPYSFDVPMPGETFAAPTSKIRTFLTGKGFGRFIESEKAAMR